MDCIVFATGFDVCKRGTPFPIRGRDGRKLEDAWSEGRFAYKSVSVAAIRICSSLSGLIPVLATTLPFYMEAAIDYIVKSDRALARRR